MEKKHRINWALGRISDILINENAAKGLNWNLTYRKENEETIQKLTDWERRLHRILPGGEYIYVREVDTGDLLYAVDVTGDSVITALSELMDLISRKF
jgi:hypothetical protein